MANNANLKAIKSTEEAREKGRKGGIASGKARNKNKNFKEILSFMLDSKPSVVELERLKAKYPDLNVTEITYRGLIGISMIGKATGVEEFIKADVTAAQFLRDTVGEKPVDKMELGNLDTSPFEIKIVE